MTTLRGENAISAWPSLLNQILGNENTARPAFQPSAEKSTLPSVNIKEDGDGFHVEIAAPGMKKEDFSISLDKSVLTVSSEKKEENSESNSRYTRREFNYGSFSRSFTLPKTADTNKIEAQYTNGILTVEIAKKEEAKPQPLRQIEIR